MAEKQYIHIRNWDRYQHPDTRRGDRRSMPWIKDFTSQIHELAYRSLSFADRGLLHSLREMYALNRGDGIEIAQGSLHSLLGQRATSVQVERLNHAGFLVISASKTLATCKQPASTDLDLDLGNPLPPLGKTAKPPTQRAPRPRRPKHPDQMTHEEKNPYRCGIGNCPIRHATKWKIEEHREVVHRVTPAQNGHVEPEVALARADLFRDTEPDLEEEA